MLVMDNLNTHTHTAESQYTAFEPAEALRLANRLVIHYTPKHGSQFDMAETELSILTKQCLDRRIAGTPAFIHEVTAWEAPPETQVKTKIDWHFTTENARSRLNHIYPSIQRG